MKPFFYISLVYFFLMTFSCQKQVAEEGKPAPDFRFGLMEDVVVRLDEVKGRKRYLNFWTITCKPCLEDFYKHQALMRGLSDRTDMAIVNICMDADKAQIEEYLLRFELDIPNIVIAQNIDEVITKYDIGAFPHHVMIDSSGIVIKNNYQEMFDDLAADYAK